MDQIVFAPGAVEEAPEEGAGGEEDVAGHGPPEGNDVVAEAVEDEGGGEPEDDGDEAGGPHDKAGVACAFERAAEDDVEGVACGPDEEDEGEHFADLEVVGKVNASFFGVEEAQEGFVRRPKVRFIPRTTSINTPRLTPLNRNMMRMAIRR